MTIIIPARMQSKRLPGKPLLLVNGTPLIDRVFKQCIEADAGKVYVASDDEQILARVPIENQILVTAPCSCGTDRVALAAHGLKLPDDEIVINIQGDMPFIPASLIKEFSEFMQHHDMGTAAIPSRAPLENGFVSVVLDKYKFAIYFSRAQIPAKNGREYYQHIGIYGYRVKVLKAFVNSKKSMLEQAESLEQLRAVENRIAPIAVMLTRTDPGPEINTPQDIKNVPFFLAKMDKEKPQQNLFYESDR